MSMFLQVVLFLLLAFPAVARSQAFETTSMMPSGSGDPRNMHAGTAKR